LSPLVISKDPHIKKKPGDSNSKWSALFVKIQISQSFLLSLVKMKDCLPTMKKYAIYGRYLVRFFLYGIYLILFLCCLLSQKLGMRKYRATHKWFTDCLILSCWVEIVKSPGKDESMVLFTLSVVGLTTFSFNVEPSLTAYRFWQREYNLFTYYLLDINIKNQNYKQSVIVIGMFRPVHSLNVYIWNVLQQTCAVL
jgi:hypothetical protein